MSDLLQHKDMKSTVRRESHTSLRSGIQFSLIRRKGKLITIRVSDQQEVIVSAPKHVSLQTIIDFIDKKSEWIHKQKTFTDSRIALPYLTESERRHHSAQIREKVTAFLAEYQGIKPKRVFVRYSNTRWGSCSSLGNISVNGYLNLLPDKLFTYVLLHELTHLSYMNHSPAFWRMLAARIPEPKLLSKELNQYKIPKKP